jgi:hypothetical protein
VRCVMSENNTALQVYCCTRKSGNEVLLVPVEGPEYAYISLVGINIPDMVQVGKLYTLHLEIVEIPTTGRWHIYGKEPGEELVQLIYSLPVQSCSRKQAEAMAQELRERGVTEVRVEHKP